MNRRDIRALACALAVMIGAILFLVMCGGFAPHGVIAMGYQNGTEAYQGACHAKPSAQECIDCCIVLTQGMPPEEKGICIDLCLDQWEGKGVAPEDVIANAGRAVWARDTSDYLSFSRASATLKVAQHSSRPRVARMAKVLCRQYHLI